MGFPSYYKISHSSAGKKLSKKSQVNRCGNAVCPTLAMLLARCNFHSVSIEVAA